MIGFLITMENINRNEHITPVFKIIISNSNYWNLEAGYANTWTCVAKSPCKISWMEYTAKYFCSSGAGCTKGG